MKKIMLDEDLYCATSYNKKTTVYSFANLTSEKAVYAIFRAFAYISAGISIFLVLYLDLPFVIALLELMFIISVVHIAKHKNFIQERYQKFVKFTGKKSDSDDMVSIVYVTTEKKFYIYEEFIEKFKGFKN